MAAALSEDAVRAHVLSLYNGCDQDLGVLLERVARVLQDAGRDDLSLESDAHGALFTLSQSTARATRLRREFLRRVDAALDPTRPAGRAPLAALAAADAALAAAVAGPRRAVAEDKAAAAAAARPVPVPTPFPTSRYAGNYILQRYGGAFPAECRTTLRGGRGAALDITAA